MTLLQNVAYIVTSRENRKELCYGNVKRITTTKHKKKVIKKE